MHVYRKRSSLVFTKALCNIYYCATSICRPFSSKLHVASKKRHFVVGFFFCRVHRNQNTWHFGEYLSRVHGKLRVMVLEDTPRPFCVHVCVMLLYVSSSGFYIHKPSAGAHQVYTSQVCCFGLCAFVAAVPSAFG